MRDFTTDRAVTFRCPWADVPEIHAEQRATKRYLLRTDVSACYASIYTHTVSWALMGKHEAKAARRDRSRWENKLDALTRSEMAGQTNGIPVGPDTSLIVAEVVLTAADLKINEYLKTKSYHGYRHVDDYEFVFDSRSEADDALLAVQRALAEFELRLNPNKTEVVELPTNLLDRSWWLPLRRWDLSSSSPAVLRRSLLEYFDTAFLATKSNPTHQVLRYAVGRLSNAGININTEAEIDTDLDAETWKLLQNLLLQAVTVERGTIRTALRLLLCYQAMGRPLDEKLSRPVDWVLIVGRAGWCAEGLGRVRKPAYA